MADHWVEVASAVGTVAAVVVALWLSRTQQARVDADALSKARLHASRISARLGAVAGGLRSLLDDATSRAQELPDSSTRVRGLILMLIRVYPKMQLFEPDVETLAALVPLPNQCAHRIARAYDLLHELRADVIGVEATEVTSASELAQLKILNVWTGKLAMAVTLLEAAVKQCEDATELGAPVPGYE